VVIWQVSNSVVWGILVDTESIKNSELRECINFNENIYPLYCLKRRGARLNFQTYSFGQYAVCVV